MNPPEFSVRRATIEDLAGLKLLWERARLQVLDLEKRLTEFQLAVTPVGDLMGAVGLHIVGKDGLLHSEAFTQPEQSEPLRLLLWERVRNLARNHGLVRMWTREEAPFWLQAGFAEATSELLKKLPAALGDGHQRWLAMQLKEETVPTLSLEQEFELFQQASKASTEEVMAQARKLRSVANVIAWVALGAAVLVVGFYFLHQLKLPKEAVPPVQQR
jgi:N-acetylglutamate synthase-like GNAT family acetyltransferase